MIDIQNAGEACTSLTSKITGGKDKGNINQSCCAQVFQAQVELNDKQYLKLIRTYRETKILLSKADQLIFIIFILTAFRTCGMCLDILNEYARAKRMKSKDSDTLCFNT